MSARWPVELAEPDPAWRQIAWEHICQLWQLLEPWRDGGVHHVGSTALPEVPAVPVIDLFGGIGDADQAPAAGATLEAAGWQRLPDLADVDDPAERGPRHAKAGDGGPAVAVELLTPDSTRWRTAVLFRDRLRADEVTRRQYGRTKRRASARAASREDYEARKSAFVHRVVQRG